MVSHQPHERSGDVSVDICGDIGVLSRPLRFFFFFFFFSFSFFFVFFVPFLF